MTRYDEHHIDSSDDGEEHLNVAVDDERPAADVENGDDEPDDVLDAAVDVPIVDALDQRRPAPLNDDDREHL